MQLISAPNAPRKRRVGHVQLFVGYARRWRWKRELRCRRRTCGPLCFARSTAARAVVKNPWACPAMTLTVQQNTTPLSGPPNLNPTFLARSSSAALGLAAAANEFGKKAKELCQTTPPVHHPGTIFSKPTHQKYLETPDPPRLQNPPMPSRWMDDATLHHLHDCRWMVRHAWGCLNTR